MKMNYMSRLYIDCFDDKIINEIPTLLPEDIALIEAWNEEPLLTHYDLSLVLKESSFVIQKRILKINRYIKSYVKKNYNLHERRRVHFFRKCLVCNTLFEAQSNNKLCSAECKVERHEMYKKIHNNRDKEIRISNQEKNSKIMFDAKLPIHNDWISIRSIPIHEHTRINLKRYMRLYELDSITKETKFVRRDGRNTTKKILYISLKGLYDLSKIKHELYRVSNNMSQKQSFDYWFGLYNRLNKRVNND